MVLDFNSFSNKAIIGMLPPERTGIAGTPKVSVFLKKIARRFFLEIKSYFVRANSQFI